MGLSTPAAAATKVTEINPDLTKVTLLNFNDFHGRIDGGMDLTGALGKNFACSIVTARATHGADATLLLSAGDSVGASSFASNLAEDHPTIEYLNTLALRSSAVGNHEFDRGFTWLTDTAQEMADFTYLGANVYERDTTTPALPEYAVHEAAGVRVAVIGVVTEDTPDMVTPSGVAGLDFGDPVEAVNRVAAQLTDGDETNGEADIIVAEYNEGSPTSVGLTEAKASELFVRILEETSPEVDVIFNGHTHQLYQWDGPNGEKGTAPATSPFEDVTSSTAFYKEITWLAETGIATGWDDGTYRPVTPINRDAMAAYLYRFVDNLGLPQID